MIVVIEICLQSNVDDTQKNLTYCYTVRETEGSMNRADSVNRMDGVGAVDGMNRMDALDKREVGSICIVNQAQSHTDQRGS